jgi:hypothetical protein
MLVAIIVMAVCSLPIYLLLAKKPAAQNISSELYQKLLIKTGSDSEKAQRLIELEKKRNPQASLPVLIRNAINRIEMHNK